MTGHELRRIRRRLGLSTREMAEALGLGPNGHRTLRRIEAGKKPPGPRITNGALQLQHKDET